MTNRVRTWVSTVAWCGAALAVGAQAGAATAAADSNRFHWPHGARAAVSLAYDDAIDSQLDNALPALNKYRLKGSFYLQLSSPAILQRMDAWRAAARAGHELGNHSLFHQCAGSQADRAWVQPRRDLDTTTAAQMQDQVELANTMLQALDGRQERTYTVPCGDYLAAGQDYRPLLREDFVAIKSGEGSGVVDDMRTLDPYAVPILAPVGLTGQQLIDIVKRAGERGTMVNFTFHGVGGDYLVTSRAAHEELLRFLAAHRAEYWTDTFLNIMKYVKRQVPAPAPPGWVLDWSDEFNGTALDHTRWIEETGPKWYNNELQYYSKRPENLRVSGGHLVIEARKEDFGGRAYTSARIKTQGLMERQYGRFEARIKIPRGQGIWPAFWMLGADCGKVPWPACGEIDIMENIGREPGIVHGTVHGPGYSGDQGYGAPSALATGAYADAFHVYAAEWEPNEIRFYRDGLLYHTVKPELVHGDWVYAHPFYLLLNLAVGGDWPGNPDASTTFPQQMLVDYVRVYRRPH